MVSKVDRGAEQVDVIINVTRNLGYLKDVYLLTYKTDKTDKLFHINFCFTI